MQRELYKLNPTTKRDYNDSVTLNARLFIDVK
jgi:hypothetical protein